MIATTPSLVTLRNDDDSSIMKRYDLEITHKATRSTYLAPAISKLLAAFGVDFINQFFWDDLPVFKVPVVTFYSQFDIGPTMAFNYYAGTWTAAGNLWQGPTILATFRYFRIRILLAKSELIAIQWSATPAWQYSKISPGYFGLRCFQISAQTPRLMCSRTLT